MGTAASRDTATRSIDTIRPLVALLRDLGLDIEAWLSLVEVREADLANSDRRITVAQSETLAETALDLTGDPALGLRVVERIGPGTADLFTYLAATSATGREAFQRATRYITVAGSDFRFTIEREGELLVCETRSATGESEGRVGRFAAEVSVGMMVKLGRVVAGDLPVNEVWFSHKAPEYAAEYDRVFELPVHFGKRCNALIGLYARFDNPLPRADSTLCDLLDQHAQALLDRLPKGDSFANRVRETIANELASGDPAAEHVAEALGMSPRTLRRRLQDEGASHQQLLDEVRNELARSYLAEGKLDITEVAFLLGFSDASAFHKAFRRWTGLGPSDWLRERA